MTGVRFQFALVCVALAPLAGAFPAYHELYFRQRLDHFDPSSQQLWDHRYLLNNGSWDGRGALPNGCRGPILLYTGNEAAIDEFWPGNGWMIEELAPSWGALLLFPEQRFYGKSMPQGPTSLTASGMRFLTTAQVLEDFALLLADLKARLGAENCPVVAFGGSYGGTLAALLRASHPSAVVGAHAASSELGYYDLEGLDSHGVDEYTYEDVIVSNYAAHPGCLDAISTVTAVIDAPGRSDADIVDTFHACDAAALGVQRSHLFAYALEALPQVNYPYEIDGMPGNPVEVACSELRAADGDEDKLLAAAGRVSDMSFYRSGSDCIPVSTEGVSNIPGDGPGPSAWGYQSCTETMHSFSSRTLRNYTFDLKSSREMCDRIWSGSVVPDTLALVTQYGAYSLADGSAQVRNIIWSQGTLDPWHGWFRNVRTPDQSLGVYHFLMEGSAHHLDLRGSNPADPPAVTAARAEMQDIIRGWIDDASAVSNSPPTSDAAEPPSTLLVVS